MLCVRDVAFITLSTQLSARRIADLLYSEVTEEAEPGEFIAAKKVVRISNQSLRMIQLSDAARDALEDYLNAPQQGCPGRDYRPNHGPFLFPNLRTTARGISRSVVDRVVRDHLKRQRTG